MELPENLTGSQKAAVLLMLMGEEFSAKIYKHLDEEEIKTIGQNMANIRNVAPQSATSVLDEFSENFQGKGFLGISGTNFFEKTISKAFDKRKADNLLEDFSSKSGPKFLEKLESLNPQALSNLLVNEHPQTIALVLVNMDYQTAAEIISELPENTQSEVIVRIAELDDVPQEIVNEIQDSLVEQLSDVGNESVENLGGVNAAAEILNQVDKKTENSIFEKLESEKEELADEIRQLMFIFEDLGRLDSRAIRALLKEVSNDELILALKTASEGLAEMIFSNVSQRAAQIMKEDMEVMGPVKLRDVEIAQQNIIKIARRLEEEGKIVLGGKGGDDVLV